MHKPHLLPKTNTGRWGNLKVLYLVFQFSWSFCLQHFSKAKQATKNEFQHLTFSTHTRTSQFNWLAVGQQGGRNWARNQAHSPAWLASYPLATAVWLAPNWLWGWSICNFTAITWYSATLYSHFRSLKCQVTS